MEKTIHITIGGTLFQLTEAAYAHLDSYLASLKTHFASENDHAEILRDIESRIAEKLLEMKHAVITAHDISAIVAEMGSTSELGDTEEPETRSHSPRKLYRDTDNAWIAGVSSGIAAYFDIDPMLVRILFFVSMFFGGTGILLYIVLWVFVPEAKTSAQKLEMRGDSVNLEGIARVVREGVENARHSGLAKKASNAVARFVNSFFRFIGKILGVAFVLGAFAACIALLIGTGIVATNWNAPYNDFPLRGAVSETWLFAGLAAGFVAILIPLIAVFALGMRLIRKQVLLPGTVVFGLIGIWALAISAAATIGVKLGGQYFEYQHTNPANQEITRVIEVAPFTHIRAEHGSVIIKTGDVQSIEIKGRAAGIDNLITSVKESTLLVGEKEDGRLCIFCDSDTPDLIITVPDLDTVAVDHGRVSFDEYSDDELSVDLTSSSLRGELTVSSLSVQAENSYISIDGSATTASLDLTETTFEGESFVIGDATLDAIRSFLHLDVTGTLTKDVDSSSRVILKKDSVE